MKRLSCIVVVALLFVVSLCFVSIPASAQDKTVTLRYSTFFPVSHPNAAISADWCKEVEKRTHGKVKVRHYAGATLTTPQQTFDSILSGVVDIGNCVLGYTMGKFPLSEILDYPLGYPSGLVATRLANEFFNKFKPKEFADVKVLYFHAQGPGIIHTTKKPITKLEDLKGMKMRTYGSNASFMSLLGGAPVAMPMGDAYDALSKGVADGLMCGYEALKGWKLGEVVKYSTENYGTAYTATFVVAMNKGKWDALPPDAQKAIEAINKEWIEKQGKLWDTMDQEGKDFILKRGNKITTLSAEENQRWATQAQPLFEEYVKKMKDKGLPGADALKFVRDYLKAQKK